MNNFKKYVEYIKNVTNIVPKTAVVLGSGLGGFADKLTNAVTVPYNKLDGFPVSTVDGHNGCFVFGYIKNTPVMVMSGRVHYYEGYTPEQTVMPVRTAALMGCKNIILTNIGNIIFIIKPVTYMSPSFFRALLPSVKLSIITAPFEGIIKRIIGMFKTATATLTAVTASPDTRVKTIVFTVPSRSVNICWKNNGTDKEKRFIVPLESVSVNSDESGNLFFSFIEIPP